MNISVSELSNGLTHIHVQKNDSEAATVIFMVGVGSRYEEKRIAGISHYLEHMFFKGTEKRKNSVEIAEYLEEVGGVFNAFTGKAYTGYYALVSKQHTERAYDFVSDLVLNATFPEEEMEKEKGVVIEEINMYNDMPMKLVVERFEELAYGDTPVGRPIIGTKESVSSFTHKDVTDYVNTHYTVDNSVVVTVTPDDNEAAKAKAEGYFSAVKKGGKSEKEPSAFDENGSKVLLATKKTDQTHLVLGFPTVSLLDENRYAASALASILGGGMSSRLFHEIREKRGLCYYVNAYQDMFTDSGYMAIRAGIDNTKVEEAVTAMMNELKKVAEEGVTEKELNKVKEYMKGKLALSLEGSQETAVYMAEQYLLQGVTYSVEDRWKLIDAITIDDVQNIIDTYLKPEAIRFALIGPFEDEEKFKSLLTF